MAEHLSVLTMLKIATRFLDVGPQCLIAQITQCLHLIQVSVRNFSMLLPVKFFLMSREFQPTRNCPITAQQEPFKQAYGVPFSSDLEAGLDNE